MKRYFKHKVNNLLIVNSIVTVHYFEFNKNFIGHTESHDFWEIVYAEKNDVFCYADGQKIHVNQGEMLFHKPGEVHQLCANGKSNPNVFIISFGCKSQAMRFFENKKIKPEVSHLQFIYSILDEAKNSFNIPFSNPYTKKMENLDNPVLGGVQMIKNHLETMLILIMRNLTETDGENKTFVQDTPDKLINRVITILQDNVYNTISVSDICDKIAYSKAYLFKKFKAITGKTVMEYYINLKIKEAKKLLRAQDLSVKDISEKLCFDTPNYFSKTFKKKTGLTPLQYKKKSFL